MSSQKNISHNNSEHEGSSVSSRTSSPDPHLRKDISHPTPQMNFLQQQKELRERENRVCLQDEFKFFFAFLSISLLIICRVERQHLHLLIHQPDFMTNLQFHQEQQTINDILLLRMCN